ncbi:MAG: hypothetical protein Kow0042_12150 [Calditrichia bacterium]
MSGNAPEWNYTPHANFYGNDTLSFVVSDKEFSDSAIVWIKVNSVNDPPIAEADSVVTQEDVGVKIEALLNDHDVDGNRLKISKISKSKHGTVEIHSNDSTLFYNPNLNFHGEDSIIYTVQDDFHSSDSARITIKVKPVNDAPFAQDDSIETSEDIPIDIAVLKNDFDIDGDPIVISEISKCTQGTTRLHSENKIITYTPNPNFFGIDSFYYKIVDSHNAMNQAKVKIMITPVNDAPIAVDDKATTEEGKAVEIEVLKNDYDVDQDSIWIATIKQSVNGVTQIHPNGLTMIYRPTIGFTGLDSIQYTIVDEGGDTSTAIIQIVINPIEPEISRVIEEDLVPFTLHIFYTNDIHGGITEQKADFLNPEFPPILGGGASAMAIMKKVRTAATEKDDACLTIDSGDIFQGTLVGTLSKGKVVVEYMNRAGYDALVPGNHDFDLGADNLKELIELSEFPWISCNILDKSTGEVWEPLRPYIVKQIKGIKFGITGTTTVGTEYMSFPENIKGLDFIPEIPALQKVVDELRQKEKVDIVVALVHTGLPYDTREGYMELKETTLEEVLNRGYANAMEIAHFVSGIDILLGGHLHRGYREAWEDPVNHTICIQNYGNGGNLGWLKVQIDPVTRSIMGYDYPADDNSLLLLQEDEFWPDSAIAQFIRAQQKIYEKGFKEIIGTTQTALTRSGLGEAPMYNLVTDAMRERAKADFAFTNYGGIRADLDTGPITREDIFRVLPFGNQMVVFQASGAFIKKIVESKIEGNGRGMAISGAQIQYNQTLPDGQRITRFLINGEPLQADKIYRVVTSDYLMEGNSGLSILRTIPTEKVAYTGVLIREAVIEYIQAHSPLQIRITGRWEKNNQAQPDPNWIKQFEEAQASVQWPLPNSVPKHASSVIR